MDKMGESQIIDFFSTIIKDEFRKKFGYEASFSIGNFSGSQDRQFADFFAGTNAVNVLIEFKEKKSEYHAESKKPFRKFLCEQLNDNIAVTSRKCHFIGWGKDQVAQEVELSPYIDIVCHIWGCTTFLENPENYQDYDFVQKLIESNIGISHDEFITYIEHLHKIAGGSISGGNIPFKSILYSYNTDGRIIGNRFDNLDQLQKLKDIIQLENKPKKKKSNINRGRNR